jgi:hypothetical protein
MAGFQSFSSLMRDVLTAIGIGIVAILVTVVVLKLAYKIFIGIPRSILKKEELLDDPPLGRKHLKIGLFALSLSAIATLVTAQTGWIDERSSAIVALGTIAVGMYEVFYGLGILIFKNPVAGVMAFIYAFIISMVGLIVFRH